MLLLQQVNEKEDFEMPLMDKYYEFKLKEKPADSFTPQERIAFSILADVTDRRGWRHAWDDFDDEVREEILQTWIEKIQKLLPA